MPDFQLFTKRMVPLGKEPYVTIQKRGTISLSPSAHLALGSPEGVELLYDAEAGIVGLKPTLKPSEHSYPLRRQGGKTTGPFIVSGTAFTKYFQIDTSASRRYVGELLDGVLCVDLKAASTVVVGNRSVGRHDDPAAG